MYDIFGTGEAKGHGDKEIFSIVPAIQCFNTHPGQVNPSVTHGMLWGGPDVKDGTARTDAANDAIGESEMVEHG